jgi:hypothetical protein
MIDDSKVSMSGEEFAIFVRATIGLIVAIILVVIFCLFATGFLSWIAIQVSEGNGDGQSAASKAGLVNI